ncbi:uncharacterized protein LOC129591052 isoform X4 [Paramacrobiotus metropolitanus]|uniref:uncharacterized protein LOC129591052 isoform X4 n=1 Tax=Paramacrobiotus metropolitanus TaxID=2943436 RepID=UPI002445B1E3|nr:uncharacterized protein LOC129591052 isoform X4 [Paramacrobiotus metropolitanus]XP_055342546.1 uncharacterized protein LOC129591052 isoform X4 [Paramacrobiotus metropolitanus]
MKPTAHGPTYSFLRFFLLLPTECTDASRSTGLFRICQGRNRLATALKCLYWAIISLMTILTAMAMISATLSLGILTFLAFARYAIKTQCYLLIVIVFTFKQRCFHALCAETALPFVTPPRRARCNVEVLLMVVYAALHVSGYVLITSEYYLVNHHNAWLTEFSRFDPVGTMNIPFWAWQLVSYPLTVMPTLMADYVIALMVLGVYKCTRAVQSLRHSGGADNTDLDGVKLSVLRIREYIANLERCFSLVLLLHCVASCLTILGWVQCIRMPDGNGLVSMLVVLIQSTLATWNAVSILIPVGFIILLQDELDKMIDTFLLPLESPYPADYSDRQILMTESFKQSLNAMRLIPVRLTAGRFFIIDRGFIAGLVGFFATYAVLVKELLKNTSTYGAYNVSVVSESSQ